MSNLLPNGKQQYDSAAGVPLVGGQLFTYVAGTSTPLQTTSDAAGLVPNTNPVILDARGEAVIFWSGNYKVVLKDSLGNTIWTVDNVASGVVSLLANYSSDSGAVNAYAAAGGMPSATYQTGLTVSLKVTTTNTGASTLNYGGLGVRNIVLNGSPLSGGELQAGSVYTLEYDGTQFQLLNFANPSLIRTAAEALVSIVPSSVFFPPGASGRYGADPTGTLDSTAAFTTMSYASWAMYNYADGQGLWNGGGGAQPIMTIAPGKYKLSGTITIPSTSVQGQAHPTNTVNHTRLVMNSTGITPARVWAAGAVIPASASIQATASGSLYRYLATTGGTSGGALPAWSAAGNTADGTVVWANQGLCTAGDNRNLPLMRFSRATVPAGTVLQDAACVFSLENLEFWFVTPGGTFGNPLSAESQVGDYPLGGALFIDVDCEDCRLSSLTFQNTACSVRIANVTAGYRSTSDGFVNAGIVNLWFENCEFDAATLHIDAYNSGLDLVFRNCAFFGGLHRYQNCTGSVRYENCRFYGTSYINALYSNNAFTEFTVDGCDWTSGNVYDQISIYGANTVNITNVRFTGSTAFSAIVLQQCNSGIVGHNNINDSGYNTSYTTPGTGAQAAIKAIDCQYLAIIDNNITATDAAAASWGGFGIYTLSVVRGSAFNFISGNVVSAPYNGALNNGQDRYINLVAADVAGVNYNLHTNTAPVIGRLGVNYQALTGAQTATFTATNKPGTATTAPAKWVPITLDGVQYYLPAWT